ncbi:MoaD/ThiS family protein [Niabella yanshanensis]|uniref:MoaD/ThiS family protein n=1 Tax=Niabella yanshanensis TaxID=577386 RepID=A0ABZ0W844_9BACT|nr:MoaD/ThiS family protein [Niabella yanshanensis]WQD37697.1 MoaD/ThiS family protein [Niabella yanshanensis]
MAIQVLFFGQLAEIAGNIVGMPVAPTLRGLERGLWEQFPSLKEKKYALSVNQKMVAGDISLTDGDIVALLPPFSGG